jgi:hypothetical protein
MNKIPEAVVEAVARAICVVCEENPDHQGDARGNKYRWHDFRDAALAAINAFTAAQQPPEQRAEVEALRQALDALEFFRDTAICEADTAVATEALATQHQEPTT